MYQPDMIPADPEYLKRVLILLLLLALLLGFVLYRGMPILEKVMDASQPEQAMQIIKQLIIFSAVFPLIFAVYMLIVAIKVYRQGQFPPEGMKVLRDTPLLFDQDARRRANILVILSALLMFMSNSLILMAFFLPKLLLIL